MVFKTLFVPLPAVPIGRGLLRGLHESPQATPHFEHGPDGYGEHHHPLIHRGEPESFIHEGAEQHAVKGEGSANNESSRPGIGKPAARVGKQRFRGIGQVRGRLRQGQGEQTSPGNGANQRENMPQSRKRSHRQPQEAGGCSEPCRSQQRPDAQPGRRPQRVRKEQGNHERKEEGRKGVPDLEQAGEIGQEQFTKFLSGTVIQQRGADQG